MRKIIAAAFGFLLLQTAVLAANSTPTDIKVMIDGKEIPSVCIYNSMYIAADDLTYFGYGLKYDEVERALFLNRIKEPCEHEIPKNLPAYFEESDIKAFINGREITNTKYAAGGKLYVGAGNLAFLNGTEPEVLGYTEEYKASERELSLTSIPREHKEKQIEDFVAKYKEGWASTYSSVESGAYFDILTISQGGTPHGTYTSYVYFGNNGVMSHLGEILSMYTFNDAWGRLQLRNVSLDGDKMYFEATKHDGRSGKYYVEMKSLAVITLEESEPDDSKRTVPVPIPPIVGQKPQKAGFNVSFEGVNIPAYTIFSRTFIDADYLLNFGYEKIEHPGLTAYIKTGAEGSYTADYDALAPITENNGHIIYINSDRVTTYAVGDINLISPEESSYDSNLSRDFKCKWNAETNTLEIKNIVVREWFSAKDYIDRHYSEEFHKREYIYESADYSVIAIWSNDERYNDSPAIYKIDKDDKMWRVDEILYSIYNVSGIENLKMAEDNKLEFVSDGKTYTLNLLNFKLY